MRWEGERESANVEDRRAGGFRASMPGGRAGGVGLGAVAVALVASLLFGVNPMTVLDMIGGGQPAIQSPA